MTENSKRKKRLLNRHKDVREAFKKMRDSKKYRYDYIINKLAENHHYSVRRIEEIIAMDDTNELYKDTNQLNLF